MSSSAASSTTSTASPAPPAPRGALARWTGAAAAARVVRPVLLANLVAEVGIVVTGGVVRLTGSGLGCPTWPECAPGSYVPTVQQAQGFHKYVEFGNRTLTFLVLVLALASLLAVWRLRPARPRLRVLAAVPLLGVLVQAVVGGVTVLTHLSPVTVASHFLLSMVLVAASAVLWLRSGEGDGPARALVPAPLRGMARLLAATTAAVLAVGTVVTGAGPHSGDASAPARFALDPRAVSWLHADLVLLLLGLLVGLLVGLRLVPSPRAALRRGWWVLAVVLGQGAIGYAQYATGLPRALVGLHMLGACLLVVAVTALLVSLRERTGPALPRG